MLEHCKQKQSLTLNGLVSSRHLTPLALMQSADFWLHKHLLARSAHEADYLLASPITYHRATDAAVDQSKPPASFTAGTKADKAAIFKSHESRHPHTAWKADARQSREEIYAISSAGWIWLPTSLHPPRRFVKVSK
jgi:hypothetical protein